MNATSDDDEIESNQGAISIAHTESTGITHISSTSASTAPQIIESNSTPVNNNVQLNQIKLQPPIPISENNIFILPPNAMMSQNVISTSSNMLGNQNMLGVGSNQVIINSNGQGGPILLPQSSVESMDTSQFGSNLAGTSGLHGGFARMSDFRRKINFSVHKMTLEVIKESKLLQYAQYIAIAIFIVSSF